MQNPLRLPSAKRNSSPKRRRREIPEQPAKRGGRGGRRGLSRARLPSTTRSRETRRAGGAGPGPSSRRETPESSGGGTQALSSRLIGCAGDGLFSLTSRSPNRAQAYPGVCSGSGRGKREARMRLVLQSPAQPKGWGRLKSLNESSLRKLRWILELPTLGASG